MFFGVHNYNKISISASYSNFEEFDPTENSLNDACPNFFFSYFENICCQGYIWQKIQKSIRSLFCLFYVVLK